MAFSFLRRWAAVSAAAGLLIQDGPAQAQPSQPVALVLEGGVLDIGPAPHAIAPDAANVAVAAVGVREPLPFFAQRLGQTVSLRLGSGGAWFSLSAATTSWETSPGSADGIANFVAAGPGVGSPDENDSRTSRLLAAPATSITLDALSGLIGRGVCAVVFRDAIPHNGAAGVADLSGPTLGVVAFTIVASDADAATVSVTVEDARLVCDPVGVTGGS